MTRLATRFSLDLYMLLCERNYSLLSLIPQAGRASYRITGPDQLPVEIEVQPAGRSVINLSMRQAGRLHPEYPPVSITIRLYHDFQVAEITRFMTRSSQIPDGSEADAWHREANEKLTQSHFLYQWLQHLGAFLLAEQSSPS